MNIKEILNSKKKLPDKKEQNLKVLKESFNKKFSAFKKIIKSNALAMEEMSKIEKAHTDPSYHPLKELQESYEFLSKKVLEMIESLEVIAPDKYPELIEQYELLRKANTKIIEDKNLDNRFIRIIPMEKACLFSMEKSGNKLYNLSILKTKLGLNIPDGFVITSDSCREFFEHNKISEKIKLLVKNILNDPTDNNNYEKIKNLILKADIPPALELEIENALKELGNNKENTHIAMRSSSVYEDIKGASCAGIFKTELNISRNKIFDSYKKILISNYSPESVRFRIENSVFNIDQLMAVGCMQMIDSAAGGVVYTKSPVSLNDNFIYINSCKGLPKMVVEGMEEPDLIKVSKTDPHKIISRIKSDQQNYLRCSSTGVKIEKIKKENRKKISIEDTSAIYLAKKACKIEENFNFPQDIEWALDKTGKIFFLQSRPLSIRALAQKNNTPHGKTPRLKGKITASPGACSGKVFKLKDMSDIDKIGTGCILVVSQPLSIFAPALGKACGLISEQGNFANHLANIARELKIPAVMNMNDAMDKLLQNETITMDADDKVIFSGEINELVKKPVKNFTTREDEVKAKIYKSSIPLNLKDPALPEFNPSNCRTFHDIIRFIHEKSVHEIFFFGKAHNIFELKKKKLLTKLKGNWLVVDLGEGTTGKHKDYLKPEDIKSIPMKAYMEGYKAIKWEGLVYSDLKEISPAPQLFDYKEKNPYSKQFYHDISCFIVSKNMCILNSKDGYHYSTLEAIVGKRPEGNYARFSFGRGAGDKPGRTKRINFLKHILQSQGFVTKSSGDYITARTENRKKDEMIKAIKAIGYIDQHSRQLDLVLKNPDIYLYYRNRFRNDLRDINK